MYKKIGILGFGEVGKAISRFYKKPLIRDLDRNEFVRPLDILHVCIPFNKNFIKIVSQNIINYKPEIVVIHSTVSIGTTLKLYKKFGNIVHSPIRGIHPGLYEGIKTFVKYVGMDSHIIGNKVLKHFKDIGIKGYLIEQSKTTEALKLWDTTQYGIMIMLEKEIYRYCQENDLNFQVIYSRANETYNRGYKKLGKPNVARPILKQMDGKILGHCVMSNAKILSNGSWLAKLLVNKNKEY